MQATRGEYVLANTPFASELERIRLLERLYDPTTAKRLDALPVQPGWRRLGVGAGGGSVVRLLADRVGTTGHVDALDMNTRSLGDIRHPNIAAREANVRPYAPVGGYDFVHTRYVLMHLL